MDPVIAMLPVGAELLERLEARRIKWAHEDFAATVRLLLDVVEFSESKAAEELAASLGITAEDGAQPPAAT